MSSWTVFGRSGNRPERDKRRNLRHTNDLLNLGTRLTAQAEAGGRRQSREQARLYRDGFMIACLAHRPLQLAKFIGLELGRHLQHRGDGWWLEIAAAEPKPHTPISLPFPELLVPTLEAYLAYWRPRLAPANQAASCPALWLCPGMWCKRPRSEPSA